MSMSETTHLLPGRQRDGPTFGVGDILVIGRQPCRITKVDGDTITFEVLEVEQKPQPYAQRPTEHLLREVEEEGYHLPITVICTIDIGEEP